MRSTTTVTVPAASGIAFVGGFGLVRRYVHVPPIATQGHCIGGSWRTRAVVGRVRIHAGRAPERLLRPGASDLDHDRLLVNRTTHLNMIGNQLWSVLSRQAFFFFLNGRRGRPLPSLGAPGLRSRHWKWVSAAAAAVVLDARPHRPCFRLHNRVTRPGKCQRDGEEKSAQELTCIVYDCTGKRRRAAQRAAETSHWRVAGILCGLAAAHSVPSGRSDPA